MNDDPGPSGPQPTDHNVDWTARVDAALDALRASGQTMTYRGFADWLAIPGPGRIQTLTRALEATMACDAAAQQPPKAALVVSRHRPGLPAQGFFECARQLGMMGHEDTTKAHRRWLEALKSQARSCATGGQ